MKSSSKILAAVACVLLVGVVSASAAGFIVDPTATWFGYVNAFELDGTTFATGFPDATVDLRATFAAGPALPLTLQPNTRLYDTVLGDPFWVNPDLSPNKVIEANMYQEADGALGENVTFDWQTVANSLPVGYTAQAFVKVLDPGAGWATVQSTFLDLIPGPADNLGLVVGPTVGTPKIQAGFYVKGVAVSATDPVAATSVVIIPEPSTLVLALVGVVGLIARRRRS